MYHNYIISFSFFLGVEEEEEEVEIEVEEVAEVGEKEEEEEEAEALVEATVIIKTLVAILVKMWIINNLSILDTGIENVIQIIEIQEDIKEVAVVEEAEIIEEIPVEIMVKITVKIMVKIIIKVMVKTMTINNRNILAKEILMGMITEVVETIIKTEEKVEEGRGVEEEAEFKVDGIKVAIIPA